MYRGKFAFQNQFQSTQIPSTRPPGGLYSEGPFNGGFFALRFWGTYIWRGLYMEGLIFGILRYFYNWKVNDLQKIDYMSFCL